MDRFLIRKMLRPVASERAHIAPSPTAGRVGGPPGPPTPRAVRSAGRFGSRVRPRHIAMDTRAADAMRPAAAGGLAAGKKTRNRLPIDVRSEERRVGKEGSRRGWRDNSKKTAE